jgi:type I restriction enzyme S subunit
MTKDLPNGWAPAQLGEIAQINPRHPKGLDDSMPVSFARMAALSESKPEFDSLEERPLGDVRKGFTHFAEGDVLFAKITPCMENGKGAVATGLRNGLGCGTTELHVLRPLAGIDPHYVYRFLAQRSVRRAATENFTGTAGQARVPTSFIEELGMPLAPLPEQRRIVAKLEALLAKVDACQHRLTKIPILLKRFRQSVLAAACSGRLTADWREKEPVTESAKEFLGRIGKLRRAAWLQGQADGAKRKYLEEVVIDSTDLPALPDSWEWASADAVCSQITDGEHIQPPYQAEGYPMLSAKHVRDGFVTLDGAGMISKADFRKALERCAPENGHLLIVSVGATTGRSAIVQDCPAFAIVRSVLLLKPLLLAMFLLRCLQSPWCFRWMTQASGASAQPHLYIKDTKRMPVPIPPLAEQQEIVRRVEALFALADQLEARFAKAQSQVDKLTPSLLARAFRGQLVPQDPDDEPASVLLGRIGSHRGSGT